MPEIEDKSVLVDVFGESPFIKVVDTLMDHPSYEYTKKELAEVNDISRPTLYKIWDRLERLEIVEPARKIGSTQLFMLNHDSDVVRSLYEMEEKLRDTEEKKSVKA